MKENDGFTINVYSPGNLIAGEITINGDVHLGGSATTGGFSDKQVARALEACVGEDCVINAKWKWAGAYWYLRWACNYPVDGQKFCARIKDLPFTKELAFACEYRNIREQITLSFMEQDPRNMDKVQYSKNDEKVFVQCREVALKLAEELGRTYLPKV